MTSMMPPGSGGSGYVMNEMIKLGGKTLTGDESLVYFHNEGKLIGLISIHVDDFQGNGTG